MADINIDQRSDDAGIDNCSLIFINSPAKLTMPLADPGADGLLGWDESDDEVIFFTAGTGLEFSTTTIQIDSTVATLTGSQTLTNKTLTAPVLGGSITGTFDLTGATITYDTQVVTLTGSQSLSNKTIASPVLSGTLTGTYTLGGTITYDSQPALLLGRSGGQTLQGDTASGGDLTLESTAHATKGSVIVTDPLNVTNDALSTDAAAPLCNLNVGDTATPGTAGVMAQRWFGATTDLVLEQINTDDWLLINNAWFDSIASGWFQQEATAPSCMIFLASGGQAITFETAAANWLNLGNDWTHHGGIDGVSDTWYIGADIVGSQGEFPSGQPGLYIQADDGDGTGSTRTQQLLIAGATDATEKLEIGLDTTGSFAVIQALDEGVGGLPIIFAQSGGNIGIGALTAAAERLDVAGNAIVRGYEDFLEIATPSDPSAGIGRLYAALDGTLHYINDASLDIELGVAGGGGLANVVDDTTPQLGAMLDVNTFGLGDGTLELLSFTETGSAVNEFTIANAATGNAPVLSATGDDANVGITLTPKGTGNVTLGTMVFDSDQTIGAGQDNYVLTYDNGTGFISLEASAGGGLANVVDDTTPQIGGTAGLDMQGQDITSGGVIFLTEQAAAEVDVTAQGQFWVKTATPNVAMFTDDAGTDFEISGNFLEANLTALSDEEALVYDSGGAEWLNRTMHEWFIQVLGDPGADRLLFFDDSGSVLAYSDVLYLTDTASGVNQITIASAITTAAPVLSATGTDANIGITLTPKGTGNITLGTMVFDSDQTIGAGQDNYVLTYDNGTGFISLEAAAASGADTALSNLAAVAINTSLTSDTDITDDLGTGDIRWRDIHAATLSAGLTATDTLKLRGRDVDGAVYVDILTITSANTVTADLHSSVTIGGNAILDSTWTGSANIATVGTITTGVWTGTDIAVADGGTGASDAATALANLGGIGSVLADTTPQLGGMLDVNGNGLGDGTLELLLFSETGTAVNEFTIANAATGNDPVLSATGDDAAIGITLTPKGTGNVTLGTMVFDADQTIGVGQDNYILTYDNGSGLISLEAASGGGADTALSNLAAVAINTSLTSDTDITDDLGTGDIRWKDIHAATLNAGLTATDTLKLRGRDVDGAVYVDVLTITSANTVTADLNAITTIGGNAILDSTWTGSANIATVGTITSGTWTGTDVAVAAGGTGASDAPTARTNLGAQAQGDVLDDLNTLGAAASDGQFIVATGAGAFAYESGATVRTSLGLGSAAEVATDLSDLNEATIEAAIDTLANLTSVQGLTVTLADAGADAILGWDDTAGAYENLTQAEVLAVIGSSSESAQGVVELATATEINTGTDATRAMSPDAYQASNRNLRYITVALVEPGTDVATATSIAQWVAPFAGDIIQNDSFPDQFAAYTTTAGTTGTMVVDIHKNGTTIMTTNKLDIETTELDTTTAATQPDLTTTTFVAGDIFTWDVDAVHTTAAKGLICTMTVRPT